MKLWQVRVGKNQTIRDFTVSRPSHILRHYENSIPNRLG